VVAICCCYCWCCAIPSIDPPSVWNIMERPTTLGSSAFVDGFLLIRHGIIHRNSITRDHHHVHHQPSHPGTSFRYNNRPHPPATIITVQKRAQPRSMKINNHHQHDDDKYCCYTKSHSLTVCLVPPQSCPAFGGEKQHNNQPPACSTTIKTEGGGGSEYGEPTESRNSNDDGVWNALTNMRVELRDPGLYRWPPHVNLLYPFVQEDICRGDVDVDVDGNDDGTADGTIDGNVDRGRDPSVSTAAAAAPTQMPTTILAKLRRAAGKVEPFWVSLDLPTAPNGERNKNNCNSSNRRSGFGTFGGSNRGVLWVYPESFRIHNIDNNTVERTAAAAAAAATATATTTTLGNGEISSINEPIVELQSLLEAEFPMCSETLKDRRFLPHMTLSSKFDSREGAFAAGAALGSKSMAANTTTSTTNATTIIASSPLSFRCKEFYLLERDGENGQFKRRATFALGNKSTIAGGAGEISSNQHHHNNVCVLDGVTVHNPPLGFPGMPLFEETWVRSELEALKALRKSNQKNRRRGGSGTRKSYRARKKERRAAAASFEVDVSDSSAFDGERCKRKSPPPQRRALLKHDTVEEIDRKRAERKARRE
jgi:hypothetical protein